MTKYFLSLLILILLINPVYAQWTQTAGPGTTPVLALYKYQDILFAGTQNDGVYKSTDNGSTWMAANTGIANTWVAAFGSNSNYLFVSVNSTNSSVQGVYRSSDLGGSWTQINNGLGNTFIASILADNSNLYVGTIGSGVWKSTDNGDSWFASNAGMEFELISSVDVSNNNIYAAASNFLYVSADQGASWSPVSELSYYSIHSMKADSSFIYVGTFGGLKRSSDFGQSWSQFIEIPFIPQLSYIKSFNSDGNFLYGGIYAYPGAGYGVIKSSDHGLTWIASNTGIEERSINSVLFTSPKILAACQSGGIFSSTDEGVNWNTDNSGLPEGGLIRSLLSYSNYVFAGTGLDGIYRTSDHGATWESFDNDVSGELKFALVFTLARKDNAIYAGTASTGIYKSTNDGVDWFNVNNGLPSSNLVAFSIIPSGNNLIVGTANGIFYSTDDGADWQASNVTEGNVNWLAAGSGFQYAVVTTGISANDGIFRSSDNGASWSFIYSTSGQYPSSLAASGSNVYLGDAFNGIQHSTDNGNGFSAASLPGIGVFSILQVGQNLFVGTSQESQNIYMSDLDATDWLPINEGLLSGMPVNALAADTVYLYAGTEYTAVWKREISQVPVELTAFTAAQDGNNVVLNWQTATETNNKGFEIQRSEVREQKSDWNAIRFVGGFGTTTEPKFYSFTDNNVASGKYSYRLKQIDFDGSYKYSNQIEVNISAPNKFSLEQNYPNPFNPATKINYSIPKDGFVRLSVYNVLGQKVTELVNGLVKSGTHEINFNAASLSSGVYYYKIETNGFVSVKKMMLVK